MKKLLVKLLLSMSFFVFMISCGSETKEENSTKKVIKVGLVSSSSGFGDGAFNDLALKGFDKAKKELGIEYDKVQIKAVGDIELTLREMAQTEEYDLIVGLTYQAIQAMDKVAPEFPEQKFALIDSSVSQPNVASYMTKDEEGSYLVGVVAGLLNNEKLKTDKVGFIGGIDAPNIRIFYVGYTAGALSVNKNIKSIPDFVGSFVDVTTTKEIANSMNNQEIKVIYHASGMSGNGLFQAAKENNTYAFGVNLNQNTVEPDVIVGSMIKNVDVEAFEAIKSVVENRFEAKTVKLGLKEKGVDFTTEGSNIKLSEEIVKKLEEAKESIINGEIKVPTTMEELK